MTRRVSDRLYPWLLAGAGWGLAFALACRLEAVWSPARGDSGLMARLLGEGRRAVSASLNERAELYFHKGVGRQVKQAFTNDWFQRAGVKLSPRSHRHTEEMGNAEILPWLQMATRTDPHNVEAQLVLAFWLSTGVNRSDLAWNVLREAQRNNSGDYRICQEMGRMAIREGRFPEARIKVETGLTLWPSGLEVERQSLLDKAEMQTLLGLIYEDAGEGGRAAEMYKNTLAIFPERAYISKRMARLLAGQVPEIASKDLLRLLVRRTTEHACTEEEHEHEGQGEHDPAEHEEESEHADGRIP